MPRPQGELTATQLEVMDAVWSADDRGASVAEIWDAISAQREVARTTVLTLVQRLEARGWLRRQADGRAARYVATCPRADAVGSAAGEFVERFFSGSATELVRSLLGSGRLRAAEVRRLRALLDEKARRGGRR